MNEIILWCNVNEGFLSAVLSLITVVVAIGVPLYIARRQDRIALFEKRHSFLSMLIKCSSFARSINNIQTNLEVQMFFIVAITNRQLEKDDPQTIQKMTIELLCELKNILDEGEFLFSFDTTCYTKPLVSSLFALTTIKESHDNFWTFYSDFMNAEKNVTENLIPKVKKELRLG